MRPSSIRFRPSRDLFRWFRIRRRRSRPGSIGIALRPLNHVIVVRESLAKDDAGNAPSCSGSFVSSRAIAGPEADLVSTPLGFAANRRNLEVAIAVADAQGLLTRPLTVDDLVTDVMASFQ